MRLSPNQIEAINQDAGNARGVAQIRLPGGCRNSNQGGFTLVELVMTMVIIGILAVTVIPQLFGTNVFEDRGAADQVKAALRYGQKVAIAQRGPVSVNISAAAVSDCGATLAVGNVNCVISNNVTVAPALPQTVTFDALGQPGAAASFTVGASTITVESDTGYVH